MSPAAEDFKLRFVVNVEKRIAELERDIANGVEAAIPTACGLRAFLEVFNSPPAPPPEPGKNMTAAEYFTEYGPAAMGRA